MSRKHPPEVRELWSVFEEVFTALAKRFAAEKPNPEKCRGMLEATIILLRRYEEGLAELIANERANARHNALPSSYPLRITRDGPIL
jgi:hypothetical protein